MDILKKLPHYMKYIINTYPDGCAAYNWIQCCYNEILADKRLPKEYEVEDILEDCLKECPDEDLEWFKDKKAECKKMWKSIF